MPSSEQIAAQSQPGLASPGEQPDKIGVREESAAQLISRIQIYQELLLDDVKSNDRLLQLSSLELDELTTRLECRLYRILGRFTTNEQNHWHYQDRINGRRDYLSQLSKLAVHGTEQSQYARGQAEIRRAAIQSLQKNLRQEVTPLDKLQTLVWEDLESIWDQLQADLHARSNNQ
jgi:hypothetical protein